MEFINEYIAIIDKKVNSGLYDLCDDSDQFKKILSKSNEINIIKNQIVFDEYKCSFKIKSGNVKGKDQRFFSIEFEEKDKANLNSYKNLLRVFKKILDDTGIILEVLRDDISFYYSELAYPEIHKIENIMRKFILYFMIVAVGKDWKKKSSTKQIEAKLQSSNTEYKNIIQELTFGQLGDFLFNSYHEENVDELISKLKSFEDKTITVVDFEELKHFIPKSNWDKYFKKRVVCEDVYLDKRWKELTDLRNKVAHNKSFSEDNWKRVQQLVFEISSEIEKAIKSIENIELDQFEKDKLSEEIASSLNSFTKNYIDNWKDIVLYFTSMKKMDDTSFENYLIDLKNKKYIDDDVYNRLLKMYVTKNNLINNTSIDIREYLDEDQDIKNLKQELSMSWKEEIIKAFKANGGTLTLDQIYAYIEANTNRQLPESWKSTIRRTIYNYSSDADIYLGKEDLFAKVGRGQWKLKGQ